jgi:hypothetical protein
LRQGNAHGAFDAILEGRKIAPSGPDQLSAQRISFRSHQTPSALWRSLTLEIFHLLKVGTDPVFEARNEAQRTAFNTAQKARCGSDRERFAIVFEELI